LNTETSSSAGIAKQHAPYRRGIGNVEAYARATYVKAEAVAGELSLDARADFLGAILRVTLPRASALSSGTRRSDANFTRFGISCARRSANVVGSPSAAQNAR